MSLTDILVEELKKEGIELAEETAKMACKALFRAIPKVVVASENKYDDMLLAVLPVIEPMIMNLLEDINKDDNDPKPAA